jgi:hypothetical protein
MKIKTEEAITWSELFLEPSRVLFFSFAARLHAIKVRTPEQALVLLNK